MHWEERGLWAEMCRLKNVQLSLFELWSRKKEGKMASWQTYLLKANEVETEAFETRAIFSSRAFGFLSFAVNVQCLEIGFKVSFLVSYANESFWVIFNLCV